MLLNHERLKNVIEVLVSSIGLEIVENSLIWRDVQFALALSQDNIGILVSPRRYSRKWLVLTTKRSSPIPKILVVFRIVQSWQVITDEMATTKTLSISISKYSILDSPSGRMRMKSIFMKTRWTFANICWNQNT